MIKRKRSSLKAKHPSDILKFMEVCGTHTNVISSSGIRRLVAPYLKLISGPGCPVCVTAQRDLDWIIALARTKKAVITTFGDLMHVPGSESTLEKEKAHGADIRIVYSPLDALLIAQKELRPVVFIGVGFETTAPAIGVTILKAQEKNVKNFYILPLMKTIPKALEKIAKDPRLKIDGFILPGHVSTIIGREPYEFLATRYHKPGVITGFEPSDILEGIQILTRQVRNKEYRIAVQYKRCVRDEGNLVAQKIIDEVFVATESEWRGLGIIDNSGLTLKKEFANFDARNQFSIKTPEIRAHPCRCGDVLLGLISPKECPLFEKRCNPQEPIGPCMVSSEGACQAYYKYERG
jgi:hydrogenase expression/formation protein HypD